MTFSNNNISPKKIKGFKGKYLKKHRVAKNHEKNIDLRRLWVGKEKTPMFVVSGKIENTYVRRWLPPPYLFEG